MFEKAEECDAKKLDIEEKEADIAHANGQIDELTQRTYLLEDELDTLRGESAAADERRPKGSSNSKFASMLIRLYVLHFH